MLDSESQEIKEFLEAWHSNGRAYFERRYQNLDYDTHCPKQAKTRRKFVACDSGASGVFLVDRLTQEVYSIKAYGVPNRFVGSLRSLTEVYRQSKGLPVS